MFKTRRKRAVVLALIAFFCAGATTYVAIDWKRFGGGFLAFLHGRGDAVASSGGGSSAGSGTGHVAADGPMPQAVASLPHRMADASRRHTADGVHGAGGKQDEDLFKYGDPAAGGIPPGSFIVAQNDTGSASHGDGAAPALGSAAPEVGSPAPSPSGGGGGGGAGGGDSGQPISGGGTNHTPPSPPAAPGPAPTPSTGPNFPVSPPPTDPIQSGGSSDGGGPPPPPSPNPGGDPGTPTLPTSPSAIPEASNLSMMALGALFLAVAAARRRKDA